MKSRKTPQQKLIFQIGSLNSNTVNEVFFSFNYFILVYLVARFLLIAKLLFPLYKPLTIYNSSILRRRANAQDVSS